MLLVRKIFVAYTVWYSRYCLVDYNNAHENRQTLEFYYNRKKNCLIQYVFVPHSSKIMSQLFFSIFWLKRQNLAEFISQNKSLDEYRGAPAAGLLFFA